MGMDKHENKIRNIDGLKELREKIVKNRSPETPCIVISCGTCGQARGALKVVEAFQEEIRKQNLKDKISLRITGCHGFCEVEPNVIIEPEGIFYQKLKPEDAEEIIRETVLNKKIIDRLLWQDPTSNEKVIYEKDMSFFKKQNRLVSGNNRFIDPTSIDDYIAIGGYSALCKVLSASSPEEVINEMKKSGLRGRGGGGFPTGMKWEICRKASSEFRVQSLEKKHPQKYIICNADEGDPGAYMDRSVLEGDPHSVLEGMLIGAYAIGVSKGFIYVRSEYPLAIVRLKQAIKQAKEYGLLGNNIFGSKFSFDIEIREGSGAFVCGEETSLMHSIEGISPEPSQRPPFPAQSGLWDKPTNINNVETWSNIPVIITKGSEWYSKIGTDKSKGTKVFSLVGKINNTGLVEVPMGISLREIIYDIGGGIPDNKKFKAVQTGGPSGGCIPANLIDLPVDYEKLAEVGSIMGSGGMVVMDGDTCVVDIARYFLAFTNDESCGKCTSCREGSAAMLEVLTRISEGKGEAGDIAFLEELGEAVKDASQCGLGQTLPNPVLSTLQHFREEYEAHIEYKKCPAGVCKALIEYSIDPEKCTGCMACVKACPIGAITGEKKEPQRIDQSECIKCGACKDICKFDAVKIE